MVNSGGKQLKIFRYVFAADDEFLDLGGTFVNLEDFRIAHQLFYRVLGVKTVSTEDLNRVRRTLVRSVTGK